MQSVLFKPKADWELSLEEINGVWKVGIGPNPPEGVLRENAAWFSQAEAPTLPHALRNLASNLEDKLPGPSTFGNMIRARRESAGLDMTEFCLLLNITMTTLTAIERHGKVSNRVLARLAETPELNLGLAEMRQWLAQDIYPEGFE